MQMNKISSKEFCRTYVRVQNYNLYLLHFFAPRQNRAGIITLMALHTELFHIPQKADGPTMRLIRLQWWRDEIQKIQNNQPHAVSPILDELKKIDGIDNISFETYFNAFDDYCRGTAVDINEPLYALFGYIIKNKQSIDKFSKKLFLHDNMADNTKFRALRLWLGV